RDSIQPASSSIFRTIAKRTSLGMGVTPLEGTPYGGPPDVVKASVPPISSATLDAYRTRLSIPARIGGPTIFWCSIRCAIHEKQRLGLNGMKIVHIITRLILGGAQENTLLSCEGQHDRGHDVTLITGPPIGPEGSLMERAISHGYRVEVIDEMRRSILPLKDWRTYKLLIKRLRELQADVVHTHSSKAGIIGRWAAHRAGVPRIVHTIHGLAFTASTRTWVNEVYKLLERKTAPITHKIVCVADAMREQSLAGGIGRPEQYVTVYSGMETEPFLHPPVSREDVRRQLGLKEDDIAIGTIARLFEFKGHEDLLDIAPKLCAEFPKLKFLWVGDGLMRSEYERRI